MNVQATHDKAILMRQTNYLKTISVLRLAMKMNVLNVYLVGCNRSVCAEMTGLHSITIYNYMLHVKVQLRCVQCENNVSLHNPIEK